MNKSKIEWCDMTWNPVTGCLHGCEYCYARAMARRFSGSSVLSNGKLHVIEENFHPFKCKQNCPFNFDPTLYKYRLAEPQRIKKPQNIFVCSMADLFGYWVPDEWIHQVFAACEKAPQHRYMFLTKNPKRYADFDRHMPNNMWFGATQTKPSGLRFDTHHSWNTFVSIEPIQADFPDFAPSVDWIIIGAETGNRKEKVIPKREWIERIAAACRDSNIPLFMKDSLKDIWQAELIRQFPWGQQ